MAIQGNSPLIPKNHDLGKNEENFTKTCSSVMFKSIEMKIKFRFKLARSCPLENLIKFEFQVLFVYQIPTPSPTFPSN
jgi:hypothetical protein